MGTKIKKLPIKTKKQRLVIYKKVKKAITNKNTLGLCELLMELSGRSFYYEKWAFEIFPEFGKFFNYHQQPRVKKYTELCEEKGSYLLITNKWRLKVLDECIKLCNL